MGTRAHPKANGEEYNIYADGLKVYVTIDSRMQQYAEEASRRAHVKPAKLTFLTQSKKATKQLLFTIWSQSEIEYDLNQSKEKL